MGKMVLALGKKIRENRIKEMERVVSCELCRDYYLLGIGPRSYNQYTALCNCDGARSSEFHKKKSITVILEKGKVTCTNCRKSVIEFDATKLKTKYDGIKTMLVVCRECNTQLGIEFEKQLKELETDIEKQEKPIISRDELMRRFKERQAKNNE